MSSPAVRDRGCGGRHPVRRHPKGDRYSEFLILITQSDNNLVIHCGSTGANAIWASNTAGSETRTVFA